MTKAKRAVGGVKKEPPKDAAEKIQEWSAIGYSKRSIASRFGVSFDTLQRWISEDSGLQEAFQAGREKEHHALFNALFTQATTKGNTTAAIFLLKARHGYREGDQSDQANKVQINFQLPGAMPMAQFTDALQATVGSKSKGKDAKENDGWPSLQIGRDHE